jgi:hypothetical protein
MFKLISHITVGNYTFDFAHEVTVESSWKNLTDTAIIKMPSKLKFDKGNLRDTLKKGNAVTIKLGYDDNLVTIFEGVVARVKPSIPVVIECEDLMWHLKQIEVNKLVKNTTLKDFLKEILPTYQIDCFDITLPRFTASKITAAKLLEDLKKDLGLYTFIRNGVITVGKQYDPANYTTHNVVLNYNVANENLEYKLKEDIKLKVTAISNMENGTKLEYELGDASGESRTLNFYNLPIAELQKVATKEFDRLVYDGFRGSITIFGEPYVRMGDVIYLSDKEDSDKSGSYWVDSVQYQFGVGGYRQTIELGARNV